MDRREPTAKRRAKNWKEEDASEEDFIQVVSKVQKEGKEGQKEGACYAVREPSVTTQGDNR